MAIASASLPIHQYAWIDRAFIRRDGVGFEPCVWFGLHAHPGRMWGLHVMLECGAVYRNLPPHALAFSEKPRMQWTARHAQRWDCYGREFALVRYEYLAGLEASVRTQGEEVMASYLFTAVPIADGFTEAPEQDKEFMFMRTRDGRLTIQPTNGLLFIDQSFTTGLAWPHDLKCQAEHYSCESFQDSDR